MSTATRPTNTLEAVANNEEQTCHIKHLSQTDGPTSTCYEQFVSLNECVPNSNKGAEAWMIIQATSPYHIMQVSSCWCDLSGFEEDAIVGRSLKCLEGPGTDQQAINRMLEQAHSGQEVDTSVIIYQRGCTPILTYFQAKPILQHDKITQIFVRVSYSETLTMKQALEEDEAWALVTCGGKPIVTHCSAKLLELTGFTSESLLSRSCDVLFGPDSNESALHDELSACQRGQGCSRDVVATL